MSLTMDQRLSVLACMTGLALAAIVFAGLFMGENVPDWMPMAISGVGGFELFLFAQGLWGKRAGGRRG